MGRGPHLLARNEIVMCAAAIVIPLSRGRAHSGPMDVVAIVIGIAAFALLLLLIEGIDRV